MNSEPTTFINARRGHAEIEILFQVVATLQWWMWWAPFGQGRKRSSAALLPLEVELLTQRESALHLNISCHAEPINIALAEYAS